MTQKKQAVSSNEIYKITLHKDYCKHLGSIKGIYSCYSSIKYDKCKDCSYTKQLKYNMI